MRPLPLLVPSLLFAAACAAPVPDDEPAPDPPVVALPVPDEVAACFAPAAEEPIGEACDALSVSSACTGICLALHATGCLAVIGAASGVDAVSLGSLTLPAGFVIAAACSLSNAGCIAGCVELLS